MIVSLQVALIRIEIVYSSRVSRHMEHLAAFCCVSGQVSHPCADFSQPSFRPSEPLLPARSCRPLRPTRCVLNVLCALSALASLTPVLARRLLLHRRGLAGWEPRSVPV